MIYLDSSVALAHLLAEQRAPPAAFWDQALTSSRLLQYEVWNKINALGLARRHGETTGAVLDLVTMIELSPIALERALEPFPVAVRALDALHLASIEFLRSLGISVELASYDARLVAGARALGIPVSPL